MPQGIENTHTKSGKSDKEDVRKHYPQQVCGNSSAFCVKTRNQEPGNNRSKQNSQAADNKERRHQDISHCTCHSPGRATPIFLHAFCKYRDKSGLQPAFAKQFSHHIRNLKSNKKGIGKDPDTKIFSN